MYVHVKRIIDFIVSLMLLLVLSPLLLAISIIISLESRGGILFKQVRSGKDKVPFVCYKFRTMRAEAPRNKATHDFKNSSEYITRTGKVLRRLGIDELPQLFNVIKGEMSLIGPRPVIPAETDLIVERDKYGANAVMPGIGGWAQSNGRDEIDYKTKARLDGEYVQNFGPRMDSSCVRRTCVAVFTSRGFKEGGDKYRRKVKISRITKFKSQNKVEHPGNSKRSASNPMITKGGNL